MNTKLVIILVTVTTTLISTSLTDIFAQSVPQEATFIFKFNARGEGLAINNTGHVFHTSPGLDKVIIYNSAGNSIFSFNSPGSPRGITVNSTGHILVGGANGDHVRIYDPLGNLLLQFGTTGSGNGQFDFPAGIDTNSTGHIFVSELSNDRVQVFDPSGNFLFKFGSFGTGDGQFNEAINIAINNTNHVFVSDFVNDRVQVFDPSGNFLFKFGSSGTGDGQFISPIGIAINGTNYVYVDDTVGNPADQRVQVFGITYQTTPTQSDSSQATGQTTILGTCGISLPNGNVVNYGPLLPNTISAEIPLNTTNSGTTTALLEIRGSNWKDGSNNDVMFVNRTHFNNSASQPLYGDKALLNSTDGTITSSFVPSVFLKILFQLETILLNPTFTGSATQTMNFTVTC
jgi:hypothetical protein